MKKLFTTWYGWLLIIVAIAAMIYVSIDEFKQGYEEGKALKQHQREMEAKKLAK